MSERRVRPLVPSDWPRVEEIYVEGIATGQATFEETPPSWQTFDSAKLEALRLVAIEGDFLVGWAAASPTSSRAVYRGVVEHSIYVAASAQGQGVGHLLLRSLVEASERIGVWTIQSSVFPENTGSLTLHAAHGFRIVGRREHVAQMTYGPHAGEWRDTLLIERRSSRVGVG